MRLPLKLNRSYWPKAFTQIIPSVADPRILCKGKVDEKTFSEAIYDLKFRTTFKSTQKARFPLTILELASLSYEQRPVVLDIGASDGITSLDIMQAIPFEKYYVTDLNIELYYQISGNTTWFYDEKGICILMVTDKWVAYPDTVGAIFPFDKIAQIHLARAPKWESDSAKIFLINPALLNRKSSNVVVEKYDVLEKWPYEKVDLIVAANILNSSYFTTSELKQALTNMVTALEGSGRIAIIDNRPSEKATIFFFKNGAAIVEKRVNGGTDIENLVINSFGYNAASTLINKSTEQV